MSLLLTRLTREIRGLQLQNAPLGAVRRAPRRAQRGRCPMKDAVAMPAMSHFFSEAYLRPLSPLRLFSRSLQAEFTSPGFTNHHESICLSLNGSVSVLFGG